MKKLNIIWLSREGFDGQSWCEYDYITKDLFSLFDTDVKVLTKDYDLFIDNSLIVYSSDDRKLDPKITKYLDEYHNKKLNFNLFHISNEQLNHDCSYYSKANMVFRNYFDNSIKFSNVLTLPLGYKTGIVNKNSNPKNLKDKSYDFCFIGQLKWDRFRLVDILKDKNSYIHTISKWACPTSLSASKMQEIFELTKLIPCPMGNIMPETFRFYETLESGSIPVIKKYNGHDYYSSFYGNHPIPVVDDWSELPSMLEKIILEGYDKKVIEVNNWYVETKKQIRNLVYSKIK